MTKANPNESSNQILLRHIYREHHALLLARVPLEELMAVILKNILRSLDPELITSREFFHDLIRCERGLSQANEESGEQDFHA